MQMDSLPLALCCIVLPYQTSISRLPPRPSDILSPSQAREPGGNLQSNTSKGRACSRNRAWYVQTRHRQTANHTACTARADPSKVTITNRAYLRSQQQCTSGICVRRARPGL